MHNILLRAEALIAERAMTSKAAKAEQKSASGRKYQKYIEEGNEGMIRLALHIRDVNGEKAAGAKKKAKKGIQYHQTTGFIENILKMFLINYLFLFVMSIHKKHFAKCF